LKISKNFPTKNIKLPSKSFSPAALQKTGLSKPQSLNIGQLLKGTVVDLVGGNKILLEVKGQQLTARTEVPVKIGSELWLEVKDNGPVPHLAIADRKAAIHDLIRLFSANSSPLSNLQQNLGQSDSLQGQELAKLLDFFEPFLVNSLGKDKDLFKILDSLLFLKGISQPARGDKNENSKLKFLSNLLDNRINQTGTGSTEKGGLVKLKQFVQLIETIQQINSSAKEDMFIFPCLFEQNAGAGQWIFSSDKDEDGKEADSSQPYSVDFFLNMSKLGDIHLQTEVSNDNVKGIIWVSDEKIQKYLQNLLPELSELLANTGFGSVNFSCRYSKNHMIQDLKSTLEEKSGIRPSGMINVRA
jgi:hypothetical protein